MTNDESITLALQILKDVKGLCTDEQAENKHIESVIYFASKLGWDKTIEAASVAKQKCPPNTGNTYLYFCKVCHNGIKGEQIAIVPQYIAEYRKRKKTELNQASKDRDQSGSVSFEPDFSEYRDPRVEPNFDHSQRDSDYHDNNP